jgi:hypothetical protein
MRRTDPVVLIGSAVPLAWLAMMAVARAWLFAALSEADDPGPG